VADENAPRLTIDRATWGVGALATSLRLAWVLLYARTPSGLSDPLLYHGYGIRIATGRGYASIAEHLTAYYPPGYPFFLGGLYWLGDLLGLVDASDLDGGQQWLVGGSQSLMWGVAAVAVVVTGRLVFSRRVGLIAGLLLACWPNLIPYAAAFLSESLFVCLFSVFLAAASWAAVAGRERAPARSWWWGVAVAAVALAAATMVRPQVLLSLVAVAAAWSVAGTGWRRVGALLGACTVALLLVMVPWALRNHELFGHVVLISTNTGDNLCVGYQDDATGGFMIREACDTGEFYTDGPAAEYRRDVETRGRALEWIADNPEQLPWLSIKKVFQTFRSDSDGIGAVESYGADVFLGSPWRGLWVGLGTIYYVAVMLAAAVGTVQVARRSLRRPREPAGLALVASALAGVVVVVAFFGDPRFKVPTTPLFALLAGVAVSTWWERRRARISSEATPAANLV
jgi:4-amino-4-deoxy-L-arabinose transferase-like glycosyltransferase